MQPRRSIASRFSRILLKSALALSLITLAILLLIWPFCGPHFLQFTLNTNEVWKFRIGRDRLYIVHLKNPSGPINAISGFQSGEAEGNSILYSWPVPFRAGRIIPPAEAKFTDVEARWGRVQVAIDPKTRRLLSGSEINLVRFQESQAGTTVSMLYITVRLGPIILLLAAPSIFLLARWQFRKLKSTRRHRAGLCINCGYDLRATPGRCPQCGTVPQQKKAVS